MGSIPNTMASVVIRIGRSRVWPASSRASVSSFPSSRFWLVRSTSKMAFLATSPSIIISPRMVKTLSELFVIASANKAPTSATGMENSTTSG